MDEKKTYVDLLRDILVQKEAILDALRVLTEGQNRILSKDEVNMDEFEEILPKKEKLINQLSRIDQGFSDTYVKVQGELQQNRETYREQVLQLQSLIRSITEKSVQLQALEQQNKSKFEVFLSGKRKQIKDFKVNSRTVSKYYKNITGQTSGESYFMDKRK